MATLTLRPHLAHILPVDAPVDTVNNEVQTSQFSSGKTVQCRILPLTAESAFGTFGVEVKQPQKMLCELADAPADTDINARVRYANTWYRIRGILRYTSTVLKHAAVLLEWES